MTSVQPGRLGYRPSLDGVRGIAIVLVLLGHVGVLPVGRIGVDLFFVLSGFLITTLLLEQWERNGVHGLGGFYVRRGLRLFPALIAVVLVVVLIDAVTDLPLVSAPAVVASLLYGMNFLMVDGHHSALQHTWSLSVEEQFYLTWPVLLLALTKLGRRTVLAFCVVGAGVAAAWAYHLAETATKDRLLYGLDARSTGLLVGCALAAHLFGRFDVARAEKGTSRATAASLLALLALALGLSEVLLAWDVALVATASGVLVWSAAISARRSPVLGDPVLQWLGQRSYGIYLWHVPILSIATLTLGNNGGSALLALAVALIIAELSYRIIEMPFLRLKDRIGARPAIKSQRSAQSPLAA